jgi:flagellar hook-associated protein 2
MLINQLLNDPYEQLIEKIIQYESTPKNRLLEQRKRLETRRSALAELQSRLSALQTQLNNLLDPQGGAFVAKTASSSHPELLRVSASQLASPATYTVSVQRLARADTRVSQQYSRSGSELRAFFDANGPQTFWLEVAHPTESDPEGRLQIAVTLNPTGSDNATILQEIAAAIAGALDQAVSDGLLLRSEKPTVSVVQEHRGTVRLLLSSSQTGYTYRLGFIDSAGGLLGALELSRNGLASGSSGGYLADPGTDAASSSLNAAFTINGLPFYRDGNTVSDAIEGLTLTLLTPTTQEVTVTVSRDGAAARRSIEDFLRAYNEALSTLRTHTSINSASRTRGPLAGDGLVLGLLGSLRRSALERVSGTYSTLAALGITADREGRLTISHPARLAQALEEDPEAVRAFFAGPDGLATRLNALVDSYRRQDGTLQRMQESIDAQLGRTNKQISDFEARMKVREEQLRRQFAQLRDALSKAESQMSALQAYMAQLTIHR